MSVNCAICNGAMKESTDLLILCEYHQGLVHSGCCIDCCSADKKPCKHAGAIYSKL